MDVSLRTRAEQLAMEFAGQAQTAECFASDETGRPAPRSPRPRPGSLP
jgi:hypothetical protein